MLWVTSAYVYHDGMSSLNFASCHQINYFPPGTISMLGVPARTRKELKAHLTLHAQALRKRKYLSDYIIFVYCYALMHT